MKGFKLWMTTRSNRKRRASPNEFMRFWVIRVVGTDRYVTSSKRGKIGDMNEAAIFRTEDSVSRGLKDSLKGYARMHALMHEQLDESLKHDWHKDFIRHPDTVEFDAEEYMIRP